MMEDDVEAEDGSDNEDKESGDDNDDDDDNDEDNDNADDADPENADEATRQLQRERETSSDADLRWKPRIRPGADTATTYDIVPYVAAPMSTSIHAFCATPCMRWVFTGGQDGYIRKFDWYASINGKVPLTVAQKHPFVDSVTRDWDLNKGEIVRTYKPQAGQLSAIQWRPQSIIPIPVERQPIMNGITSSSLSKLANGLTNGSKSPKAEADADADAPGSPASSGGFDSLFGGDDDADDLFGQELSNGRTAQNSTLTLADGDDDVLMGEAQPAEQQLINENASMNNATDATEVATQDTVGDINIDIPDTMDSHPENPRSPGSHTATDPTSSSNDVSSNIFLAASIDGIVRIFDRRQEAPITKLLPGKGIPPWSTSACWGVDGNYVYVGRRNGTVEEYSIHKDFQHSVRTLKFPGGSGAVSYVTPMVNGRHLVWYALILDPNLRELSEANII
ncbi:hypothetical protein ABW19_dt0202838 [Dactylella cylindrospora]|nr:hypothetical protein ABW19_dt0202838 [Dactylella cylindrospora]